MGTHTGTQVDAGGRKWTQVGHIHQRVFRTGEANMMLWWREFFSVVLLGNVIRGMSAVSFVDDTEQTCGAEPRPGAGGYMMLQTARQVSSGGLAQQRLLADDQ